MTVEEILKNEELRRYEFPVTSNRIYLSHAGVCSLPRRVAAAMNQLAESSISQDQESAAGHELFSETRALAARLIECQPGEIAFVGPTSLALSYVAGGIYFSRHSNVLIYHDDYPANVYPWMTLADRGVEVRLMNIRQLGRIRPQDVTGQVDENTKLVALASCHYLAGYRIDIAAIGKELKERNILFSLDAIQTLGAFPTKVESVDFLCSGAHKWLLGPCGAGLMYVRQEIQEKLRPIAHGWFNVRSPNFVASDEMVYRSDARKYEAGTHNLAGLAGLKASLELILELGVDNIAAELLRKRAWVTPELQRKGFTVLQADSPKQNWGGMFSFYAEGKDMAELHQKLEAAGIWVNLRIDRTGKKYIRISPHFFNTDEELNRMLELL
ncbi:MAG: aminotransferase class V-fold PLP-dependent enzyme [Verrucomicrobiota bacterium]|nr:aminotransferase class V-fold PLP-dependent enzyme [Verrucomicrobiota bacterium]